MPRYCHICGQYRPNDAFTGKGWRKCVCKRCYRIPKAERQRREDLDRLYDMLDQRNISQRNIERLTTLVDSAHSDVADLARLVLEVALAHPRRRKRIGFLARERPDLLRELRERGLVPEWCPDPPEPDLPELEWAHPEYEGLDPLAYEDRPLRPIDLDDHDVPF